MLPLVVLVAAISCGGCGHPRPNAALADAAVSASHGAEIGRDGFSAAEAATWSQRWLVEQQPGGTVSVEDGKLIIQDAAGCTVWWRHKLTAPVVITFKATVSSRARVSDLNCFWMASDPARANDLFAPGHTRDGRFATYDTLRTYYVGYGGNHNSTTRFRRYDGNGARPLLPEHDLGTPPYLLEPDRTYSITLIADGKRARYLRDGEVIFDYEDPAPLTEGWFGFRTVQSRIEISDFSIRQATFP